MKRPTSIIPNIPDKIPAKSRNTSTHVTNIVRNKDLLYVLPRSFSKVAQLLQFQIIVTMLVLLKTAVKFLFWVIAM